jgi:GWxTD domain-containing protein
MNRMRIVCCMTFLLFTANVFAADPSLPQMFKQAKDKFTAGDYKSSLADLDTLDAMSAQPGHENDRAKLLPVLTFYRGANLAALGRKDEAREAFASFLTLSPNGSIASPPFPKTTVDLFEDGRKLARGRSTSLATVYSAFTTPAGWTLQTDEHWIESPVRYLLTPAQKKEYSTFTTNAERASFIDAFWKQLDPTPTTDVNEFRNEFERRLAFADTQFSTPKVPGRFTDSAAVFTFLGPPTYASQSQLASSDDVMGQLRSTGNSPGLGGTSHTNAGTAVQAPRGSATNIGGLPTNEDNLEADTMKARREAWYYRPGRIPQAVPYKEVRFDFLTKAGYGTGVLQKDPQPMQTLGILVETARRDRRLN